MKNNFAYNGAIFFLNDNMTVLVESASIQQNGAIYDSAILHSEAIYASIKEPSSFSFGSSTFKDNYVRDGFGSFAFINNEYASLTISSSSISNFTSSRSQLFSVGLLYTPEI